MNIDTAKKISHLTEINNHNQAIIEIASYYDYLKKYLNIFLAIQAIHNYEGSMPFALVGYRSQKINEMLKQIEATDGLLEAKQIYQLI